MGQHRARVVLAVVVMLACAGWYGCASVDPADEPAPSDAGAADADERDRGRSDAVVDTSSPDTRPADGQLDSADSGQPDGGDLDGPESDAAADVDVDPGADTVGDTAGDTGGDDLPPDVEPVLNCAADRECAAPTPVCSVLEAVDSLVTECRAAVGSAGPGAACTDDAECASGRCLGDIACAAPCIDTSDCPEDGQTCQPYTFVLDDGGTTDDLGDDLRASLDLCLPGVGSLTPCLTVADCLVAEETCAPFFDQDRVDRRCLRAVGTGTDGACSSGVQCQTGICLDGGICFWPCTSSSDCGGDHVCGTIVFVGTGAGTDPEVPGCVPRPDTCSSSEDCGEDEVCQVFLDPEEENRLTQLCDTEVGTLENGAVCTEDSECRTGDCFLFNDGSELCLGPCDVETQAGCVDGAQCYPNAVYVPFDQGTPDDYSDDVYDAFPACLLPFGSYASCVDDDDCPADETCTAVSNRTLTDFELRCVDREGAGAAGDSCSVDADCRTDLCLDDTFCFGVCDPADSICTGERSCSLATFIVDERDPDDPDDDVVSDIYICQ